jgi:glutamate 5-kinase
MNKLNFTSSKRIVIKIGSSIITKNGDGIDNVQLKSIVEQIAKLVAKKRKSFLFLVGPLLQV